MELFLDFSFVWFIFLFLCVPLLAHCHRIAGRVLSPVLLQTGSWICSAPGVFVQAGQLSFSLEDGIVWPLLFLLSLAMARVRRSLMRSLLGFSRGQSQGISRVYPRVILKIKHIMVL